MTAARAMAIAPALLLATALGAGAGLAHAHTGGRNGYAAIAVDGASVRYTLTLWPATLPSEIAQGIRDARAGDTAARDRLLAVVREKVALTAQARRCGAGAGSARPGGREGESLTLAVEFACGAPVRELVIRDDLFDVLGADYHTLARIDGLGPTAQFAFQPDARETRVTAEGAGGLASFALLGVAHILGGWDHLLFLLALLLRGGGWWSLVRIVTAFTCSHSVTLALAVLDVVTMPDRLVEAVIALSIALVAAENLVARPVVARRWVVSFCFGLVHGFGFSSALREAGLPADGLVRSLLGFNLGVELGQALVVAAALPLLALVRRTRWERRVIWGSSAAMLALGVVLFVERALL